MNENTQTRYKEEYEGFVILKDAGGRIGIENCCLGCSSIKQAKKNIDIYLKRIKEKQDKDKLFKNLLLFN